MPYNQQRMRKLPFVLLLLAGAGVVRAEVDSAQAPRESILIDRPHAQDWMTDINQGWRVHEGDNLAYASPAFDDSAWQSVSIDDLGAAKPGWRWFRLHVQLHENHPQLALLVAGGEDTYEIYLNGVPLPGARLKSPLAVRRPVERVFPIDTPSTDVTFALRTYIPPGYVSWHLPQFMTAAIGTPDAIETERQAFLSTRLYAAIPAIAINLLLIIAGIAAFALWRWQPDHLEYMWLGIYLFLTGLAPLLWDSANFGLLPVSANSLLGDPMIYLFTIAQIEFTFCFGSRRVTRPWRIYESLLLAPLLLVWLSWRGIASGTTYLLIEGLIVLPAAFGIPVLLTVWYRRGNHEAGWLILPSLLPAANIAVTDLGSISIYFGWQRLDFLANPVPIGAVQLQTPDIAALLFLFAIAIVMFFRFTRVSREQARAAAELDAAREIQRRLVPEVLPQIRGLRVEAAYRPAQEVGGDFYQVMELPDGAALIVVGDVSGKGLKAAMTGTLAIGALRILAAEDLSPATILSRMNQQIIEARCDGFITCLCMRLESDGTTTVANAGHLAPYRNAEEITLDPFLPLGLTMDVHYTQTMIQIEPGDTLTLLSDGIIEARNVHGHLFGFDRTRSISAKSAERIADAAQEFGQEDDITVLTLARVPQTVTV